jgi:hypothetical protein
MATDMRLPRRAVPSKLAYEREVIIFFAGKCVWPWFQSQEMSFFFFEKGPKIKSK